MLLQGFNILFKLSKKFIVGILIINICIGVFRGVPIHFFSELVKSLESNEPSHILIYSGIWAISELTALGLIYFLSVTVAKWRNNITTTGYNKVLGKYLENADRENENDLLVAKADLDTSIGSAISIYEQVTKSFFTVISITIALALISVEITIIYLFGSAICILTSKFIGDYIKKFGDINRELYNSLFQKLQDFTRGLLEIRTRGNNLFFQNQFDKINNDATSVNKKIITFELTANRIFELFLVILMALILWVSSMFFLKGKISIAGIAAIVTYGKILSGGVMGLINSIINYKKNSTALSKCFHYLKEVDIKINSKLSLSPNELKAIEVSNVLVHRKDSSFTLDVGLKLAEGCITVLIGDNGSGKSTLLDCIYGNLKCEFKVLSTHEQGNPIITKKEVTNLDFISGTIQEPFFVNSNLISNIMIDRKMDDYSKDIINRVQELTGLDMNKTLEGLESPLSGGQEKMIIFARSLVHRTKYLFFDEPTVYLDIQQKSFVIQQLLKLKAEGHSVLVVSHDDDIIKLSDNVVSVNKSLRKIL